jgi:3-methylcrotonyl-CoA carboxylase beta subunit
MTAKKVLRAQTIALDNRIPTLYLVDSSGVFLPFAGGCVSGYRRFWKSLSQQRGDELAGDSADHGDYGDVRGGRRVSAGDDGYGADDRGVGLFLAGPSLVQAAIGQKTGAEELGGAAMHAEISGTVDFKEPNDHLCLARLRSLVGKIGERHGGSPPQPAGNLSVLWRSMRCGMRRSLRRRSCTDC